MRTVKLLCFLTIVVIPAFLMAGDNVNAGFSLDIELSNPGTIGDQGVTNREGVTDGAYLYVHLYAENAVNLDAYEFKMTYDPNEIKNWGYTDQNNPWESNILGADLSSSGSVGSDYQIVSRTANGEQTDEQAPDGDGYIGYFLFEALVDNPIGVMFTDVQFVDNDGAGDNLKSSNIDREATFGGGSLPVELSSFTANLQNDAVLLQWTTESEQNALGFNVLRSETAADGYIKINSQMIKAAGTSATPNAYTYRDTQLQAVASYWYMLEQVDTDGATELFGPVQVSISTDVAGAETALDQYRLYSNFPNPFNPVTLIRYNLPVAGYAELTVFDMTGRRIQSLVSGHQSAGQHVVRWDGTDHQGNPVSSGVYIYSLQTGNEIKSRKMMLLR